MKITSSNINFGLNFNGFSIFSFVSAAADLVTIYLVLIKKRYNSSTNWFLLFLGGATVMALTEGLQRSSVNPQAAIFWQNFAYLGLVLLSPIFYLFIVSYASQYKKQFVLLSSVLMLTLGIVAFYVGGSLFYLHGHGQIYHTPWGYQSDSTPSAVVGTVWYTIFYILGTGLLVQLRKTTQNQLIKKQLTIFMVAFLAPYVTAIVTNVILPKVMPNVIPPLATFVGAFSAIIIFYGMRKYRLFDLDPQILAQNILDTMSERVIITRVDRSIESINPEAERLLGVKTEDIGQQQLQNFFSEDAWKLILDKIKNQQLTNSNQLISNSEVKSVDGKVVPVRIAVTSLVDGGEKMANILVLSDISEITRSFNALQESTKKVYQQNEELIRLEDQLREEKAGVEHTVTVRTKELVDAQEKLKADEALKTEFIMLTSHNLRTPLATIQGSVDMLSEVTEDDKPLVEGLKAGIKRLGTFVEDLLTISSIEAGNQLTLKEIPFEIVIRPLIQEATDLARTRNDKLVVNLHDEGAQIKANVTRLQAAIRNLLDNACKYTENGTIELSTKRIEDKLCISVSDTGIGIEASELPRLYTKFHRATNAFTSSYEGEGVGLYLTKLIVDEHKGTISVVSTPGKGSTFTIELPCL